MKDNEKTKEVLLNELKKMNQRINDLELSKKKIEKSEEMAYKFLDTIPDLAMLVQIDNWIILALNESMAKSFGKNKKELIGTNILDVFSSDVAKHRKEQAKKLLQDRKPVRFEDERNGKWFYNTFYPIFDSKGKITHGAIFVHEITEQKKIEQKKLKNQEEYFYHLIQNSSDLISIVEADGTIRYQSPSLEKLFGYTPNETAGRNIFEFFHPDQIPHLQKYFKEGIKKPGLAATVEYRLRHKNGSWVHCESTGSNLLGDPNINGIVISTRDVTKRKQMENALRESETRFRNIFDNCPIGIYRTTPDGKILMSNSTLVQMLGYSSFEELAQRDLESKAYHPEYPRINFKKRIESEKQIIGLESAWIRKDGSTLFVRENAKAVYDSEGNVLYYEGTVEDITKYKQAETALRASEERYRQLIECSPEAIVVHREGDFVYINPAGVKLVGAKNPEELIGKNIMDFIHPDYKEIVQERVQKGYKGKKAPRMEEKFLGLDGQVTDVEVVATPIVYQGESAVQVIIHNITERKKAERELKQANEIILQERNMFISGPVVVFKWQNQEGWPVEYNSSNVKDIMGYTSKDFISQKVIYGKIIHGDDLERVSNEVATYSKNDAVSFEHKPYRIIKKDGKVIWVSDYTTILRDKTGKITHYLGYIVDITGIKQAEEQLKLLSSTVEQSTEGMAVSDLEGNLLFVNDAFSSMHGYTQAELIGKHLSIFHTPKQIPSVEIANKQISETGKFSGEIYHARRDGTVFPTLMHNSLLKNEEGKVIGMIGTVRDITKLKKTEQEIIITKEHLKNVINSASEIIISIDIDNKISTWNKTAEIIMGYKQREIIGRSINSLDTFEDASNLLDNIKNIYEGHGKPVDWIILRTKTGAKKLLQISCSIIQSNNEDIFGILLIGKDITQDSEAHGQLLQGNSYLITDEHSDSALNLFTDLAVADYNGLFITRDTPDAIRNVISSIDVKTIVLSQDTIEEFEHIYELDKLTDRIKEFIENEDKPIILFDRIDYFLTNFSFETVIKAIYRINNIVTRGNAVLLLRLKPSIVNMRQLALIKEELQPLPSQKVDNIELEEYLHNILKFIYDQNQHNVLVSYRKISQEFSISKVTTAKRLNILKERELLLIKKQGKTKSIHISEKGKTLLHKRKII